MSDQLDLFGSGDAAGGADWSDTLRVIAAVPGFPDTMTLGAARAWLEDHVADGTACPCCGQNAKAYRRKMTSVAARAVVELYRHFRLSWGSMPELMKGPLSDVANQGGYLVLAQHWGLIEEERTAKRDDGGRAGFWRVTQKGEWFIHDRVSVPMYVRLYDGRALSHHGDLVGIRDVLGEHFDYGELMAA